MALKLKPIPNTTKLSELEARQNYVQELKMKVTGIYWRFCCYNWVVEYCFACERHHYSERRF